MSEDEAVKAVLDPELANPETARRSSVSRQTAVEYVPLIKRFKEWCQPATYGERPPRWHTPLPCETDTLTAYVTELVHQGRAVSTIRKARSAILWWHDMHGARVPDERPSTKVLSAYKASLKADGLVPKRTQALPFDAVLRILGGLDRGTVRGQRDAAVLTLAYAGVMHASTLFALRLRDVTDCAAGLYVRRHDGPAVTLPHWKVSGSHDPAVCVVEAVVTVGRVLLARGATGDGPLIRAVDRFGRIAGLDRGWAGTASESGFLEPEAAVYMWAEMLTAGAIEDPGRYSFGSIRAGGLAVLRASGLTLDELAAVADRSPATLEAAGNLVHVVRDADGMASLIGPDSRLLRMDGS